MNNDHTHSSDPTRLITMLHGHRGALVVPLIDSNPPAFNAFWIPPMPMSQTCWLTGLAQLFHRKHERCIVAHLMLDSPTQRWLEPDIPTQRCAADGAYW